MNIFRPAVYRSISVLAVVGIIFEVIVSAGRENTVFDDPLIRALHFFATFTALMLILVAATSHFFAKSGQSSKTTIVVHLSTLLGLIVVTVMQYAFLAKPLEGFPLVSDLMIHAIVPGLYILAWFVFGPAVRLSVATVAASFIIPTIWLLATILRGMITGWYPYDFINPAFDGVVMAVRNVSLLYGLMFLTIGCIWLRERLRQLTTKPKL